MTLTIRSFLNEIGKTFPFLFNTSKTTDYPNYDKRYSFNSFIATSAFFELSALIISHTTLVALILDTISRGTYSDSEAVTFPLFS